MEKLFIAKNDNKKIILIEELYNRGDFSEALKEIKDYLSIYPDDLKILFFRGKVLRMLKANDEARLSFISLFPYIINNREYKIKVLVELVYLEMYERNYLDAYSYLKRLQKLNCSFLNSLNIALASIYLSHQTKMNNIEESNKKNYFEQQICCYQENIFLKRLLEYQDGYRKFNEDINLEELFNRIKNVISLANITPAYNVFDTYIFYYPLVGFDMDEICDYIKVLAYQDDLGIHVLEITPFKVDKYKNYINDLIDLECQKEYSIALTKKK
jgi:tetratricopeptide (TPR) repeat protein